MSNRAIGIDIGGTKVLGVVADVSAPTDVLAVERVATPRGEEAIIDAVARVVDHLTDGSGEPVGVGIAGLVDRHGVVRTSPNLPGVERLALGERLVARLGREVAVDNDANTAALAEASVGAPDHRGVVLFVALGTGVGGGVVVDGQLRRGENGFAGEFGHVIIAPGGVPCVCGRFGCFERYASGSALERMAREHRASGRWPGTDPAEFTGERIIEAARAGDDAASSVLDEFCGWVGLGIANFVTALDPSRVILGGGVLDAADVLLDRIRLAVDRSLFGVEHRRKLDLSVASLGSMAGAVGAAILAADPGRGF